MAVSEFTAWRKATFLEISTAKTKEMVIDFGKSPSTVSHVEIVKKHRYLGIV